jgi:hypothetical protein
MADVLVAVVSTVELVWVPSFVMLCGSVFALCIRPPSIIVSALQHLAAGIILSTVGTPEVFGIAFVTCV